MLVKEACGRFLDYCQYTKKLSHHSIRAYERDLQTFLVVVGRRARLEKIDRKIITRFVDACFADGLSHATVKRRLACLKALFKWLENEEILDDSPFRKFELKVRLPHRLPRNLSVQELNKLLRICRSRLGLPKNSDYRVGEFASVSRSNLNHLTTLVCIELLFTTGVRVGELTGIRLQDIYLHEKFIHIRGKGQRERRVFVTDKSIRNLIESYVQLRKITTPIDQNLLVNSRGRPATSQMVRIWLKNCSKAANLTRVATPHMYRHSTATELLNNGVDIIYVQKLLGHQSISTTQIYAHVSHSDVMRNVALANIRKEVL
ncbi:tyrosine-type recombinase/integrase [Teredinibacter turnerae]|uniref:tyrosine-type recombinase/integrase n=1 Tax=Teredinibacter turnerae TaxID=2426 RepID=UPI000372907B|nr:tyrosine-type recombinase/integrase [Teredinibacter turnerae]